MILYVFSKTVFKNSFKKMDQADSKDLFFFPITRNRLGKKISFFFGR